MRKLRQHTPVTSVITLLLLVVFSCKQNNDVADGDIPAASVGAWSLTTFQLAPADRGVTDLKVYYNDLLNRNNTASTANCYGGIVYDFRADGTINLSYPSSSDCIAGSTFTYFDNGAKWSINGNKLIVTGVRRRVFDITNSTANAMTLSYQSTSDISGSKVTYTYTAVFNK
jgi:hypothetical protein